MNNNLVLEVALRLLQLNLILIQLHLHIMYRHIFACEVALGYLPHRFKMNRLVLLHGKFLLFLSVESLSCFNNKCVLALSHSIRCFVGESISLLTHSSFGFSCAMS